MNEAAIYAVRSDTFGDDRGRDADSALDRLTVGQNKDTGTNQKKRQELVAWHEAGHARDGGFDAGLRPGGQGDDRAAVRTVLEDSRYSRRRRIAWTAACTPTATWWLSSRSH